MDYIEIAKQVFDSEITGLKSASDLLDKNFSEAIDIIASSNGRVIVCGMGKSGIIAKKIAATLASTGTQSYFMHPGEAFHGDLGMVNSADIFIGISYSGETEELLRLIPFLSRNGNILIGISGNPNSTLARNCKIHLNVYVPAEACPLQLAPTSSTTATLVMGDAIAVALMSRKKFKETDFACFHPGGALGRRLLSTVRDEVLKDNLPIVDSTTHIGSVISAITKGGLGLALVRFQGESYGIITDGDIRRALEVHEDRINTVLASEITSMSPLSIDIDAPIGNAWDMLDKYKVSSLLVFEKSKLYGIYKR